MYKILHQNYFFFGGGANLTSFGFISLEDIIKDANNQL